MDLFYGNDGTNYRIFAQSPEIPAKAVELLLNNYMKYYFVKDKSAYSSISQEPESIYYVTSDLNRQLPSEKVILCKNGHMTRFSTPSFFFHAHLENIEPDFYKKDFFKIFSMEYISDTEMGKYTNTSIDEYQVLYRDDIRDNGLNEDQLKMILYKFFYNERMAKPVRILLDQSGDDYNRRSREVLKAIYQYLPYNFRKRYGFLSYCDEMQSCPSRISFILYDRAQVKDFKDMDIDLLDSDVRTIRNSVNRPELLEYVDYIIGLSGEKREEYFDTLEQICEGRRLNVQDCISYFAFEKRWQEEDAETLMPEWVDYVYKNALRPSPMYHRLLDIIVRKIDNDFYNKKLFALLEKGETDLANMSSDIKKSILFAEHVSGLSLDQERFLEWIDEKYPYPKARSIEEKREELQKNIEILQGADIGSAQLKEILHSAIECREASIEELNQQERKDIEAEKAYMVECIQRADQKWSFSNAESMSYMLISLKYPENKEFMIKSIEMKLDVYLGKLEDKSDEINEKLLKSARKTLSCFKENMDITPWETRLTSLEDDYNKRMQEMLDTDIRITSRTSLIEKIRKLEELRAAFKKYHQEPAKPLTVHVQTSMIEMSLEETENFIEFLLVPTQDNAEMFYETIMGSRHSAVGFLRALLDSGLLVWEHCKYYHSLTEPFLLEEDYDAYFRQMIETAYTDTLGKQRESSYEKEIEEGLDREYESYPEHQKKEAESKNFVEELTRSLDKDEDEARERRDFWDDDLEIRHKKPTIPGRIGGLLGSKRKGKKDK